MFCHEVWQTGNVHVFFDENWFQKEFGQGAPGFWGAGTALALLRGSNLIGSVLGYLIKQ